MLVETMTKDEIETVLREWAGGFVGVDEVAETMEPHQWTRPALAEHLRIHEVSEGRLLKEWFTEIAGKYGPETLTLAETCGVEGGGK